MTDEPRTYNKRGYRAVNEVRAQDGERFIIRPVERRYEVMDRKTGEVRDVFENEREAKRRAKDLNDTKGMG